MLFSSSHKIWGPHKLWRMAWSRAEAAKTKRPQLHMVRVLGPGACPCPCPCPLRRPRLAPPPATTTIRHPHPLTILTQKRHHSTTPSAVRSDETMTPAGACQRVRCLRTGEGGGGFPIPNLPSRAVPLAFSEKRERARLTFYIFTSLGSTSCEFPLSWSLLPSLPPVSTPPVPNPHSACTAPRRADRHHRNPRAKQRCTVRSRSSSCSSARPRRPPTTAPSPRYVTSRQPPASLPPLPSPSPGRLDPLLQFRLTLRRAARRRRHRGRRGLGWCRWPPRRRSSAPWRSPSTTRGAGSGGASSSARPAPAAAGPAAPASSRPAATPSTATSPTAPSGTAPSRPSPASASDATSELHGGRGIHSISIDLVTVRVCVCVCVRERERERERERVG